MSVGGMTRRWFLALGALAQGFAQGAADSTYCMELLSPNRHADTSNGTISVHG